MKKADLLADLNNVHYIVITTIRLLSYYSTLVYVLSICVFCKTIFYIMAGLYTLLTASLYEYLLIWLAWCG